MTLYLSYLYEFIRDRSNWRLEVSYFVAWLRGAFNRLN